MKILITTQIVDQHSPLLGFFHGWLLEFAKRFEEVHVICLQLGEHSLPDHVHLYSLGKEEGENKFKYTWRFYKYFIRIFFKVRVDYVFFHMGAVYNVMAAPMCIVRRLYGTKFYWWKTHGHINLLGRLALMSVDRVYTAVAESFLVKTKKRQVVGHAIDTELFQPGAVTKEANTILFTGRFARSKRLEQVIEITRLLKESGVPVKTTCIGMVVDEPYYEELKEQVRIARVVDEVVFIEGLSHPELVAKYQASAVFINPSDNDGLDKVVLEAILCGTLPLTGNRSFADMLKPHDLFLAKGDMAGYVDKVKSIFALPEDTYNKKVAVLRAEVQKQHSLSTIMDRIFTD